MTIRLIKKSKVFFPEFSGIRNILVDGVRNTGEGSDFHYSSDLAEIIPGKGGLSSSRTFRLITKNPAKSISLPYKGNNCTGTDTHLCFYDDESELTDDMTHIVFWKKNKNVVDPNFIS